mmetsp:Transcript_29398/g.21861  ORF Transcript_29398/g.21861 Transcript_29398/m.21861 type:complete len:123 (-) Transcript_29398:31-399(-)
MAIFLAHVSSFMQTSVNFSKLPLRVLQMLSNNLLLLFQLLRNPRLQQRFPLLQQLPHHPKDGREVLPGFVGFGVEVEGVRLKLVLLVLDLLFEIETLLVLLGKKLHLGLLRLLWSNHFVVLV